MKSKIDWVRRGQRVIRMVSELHRMGYQHLRLMPYLNGEKWRLAVSYKEQFSERNGAFIPHEKIGQNTAIYSAAGGGDLFFDWTDAKGDDARALAEKFVARFPTIAERGKGRDWEYVGWAAELVGYLEQDDWLPAVYWDYMKGTPDDLRSIPIWVASKDNLVWDGMECMTAPDNPSFSLPPNG